MTVGRTALLFGLGLAATAAHARPDKPALNLRLDDYSLSTMDYCFSSGLRIMLPRGPFAADCLHHSSHRQGSDADPIGLEGMAHLIEHLWFRSVQEGEPKVWDMLDEMGAVLNAFTSVDVTAYMTVVPNTALEEVLKLRSPSPDGSRFGGGCGTG